MLSVDDLCFLLLRSIFMSETDTELNHLHGIVFALSRDIDNSSWVFILESAVEQRQSEIDDAEDFYLEPIFSGVAL